MASGNVFSGARTIFKLADKAVGFGQGVSGTTGINYQPVNVLGHLEVVEHVPTAYTVEMSAVLARLARFSRLYEQNSVPGMRDDSRYEGGSVSPAVMTPFGDNGLDILTQGELTATIVDVVTQTALYTIQGVKCGQKAWDIQAAGMVAENCTFVARISSEPASVPAPAA